MDDHKRCFVRYDAVQLRESMDRRLKAICDIARYQLMTVVISDASVAIIRGMRDHLRQILVPLVAPVFQVTVPVEPRFLPYNRYIEMMFSGFEMSSFMVIQEWLTNPEKTAAHIDSQVLGEAMEYYKMYDAISNACGDRPMSAYKMLAPGAPLIHGGQIMRLKYCAVSWRKSQGDSWAKFADIRKAGSDSTARLDALMKVKVKVTINENIAPQLVLTARRIGITVNDQGKIETTDQGPRAALVLALAKMFDN